jgi:predicted RNase H-like HicB family nuclease
MEKYMLQVVLEQDEDGVYIAHCPALEGCYVSGRHLRRRHDKY